MIASGRRIPDSSVTKLVTTLNEPSPIKSGIIAKVFSPAPPPASASQHAPLSRRQRKNLQQERSTPAISQKPGSRRKLTESASFTQYRDFGLEVKPNEIVWRGWEPGEEYTKNITLKNINLKTQKIRYKVPSTRFFSTLFPQVIVLSAGTSFTLPLTFRPLAKETYQDAIEFITSYGTFSMSLQGLLPETKLHLPESLHFGLVAAHDHLEITFEIKNMSTELVTSFSWEVPDPFTIIPLTGSIPPRGSCSLKAIFHPLSASVFETFAICCYGENNITKNVKLEGIGKFPHLLISTGDHNATKRSNLPCLSFGGVRVGEASTKFIALHNLSQVRVPFKIRPSGCTPTIDEAYTCPVREGMVPASGELKVPVCFKPTIVGQNSIDYFEVSAIGDFSKSIFKCEGQCEGPEVLLSSQLLDFGMVHSEKEVTKTLDITNGSKCVAVFQVLLDPHSTVWHFNESSGILKAGETRTLLVTFTPVHTINYYRRLVVLVHEQGPLFIDLIGTCHTGENHPPQLKPLHLRNYKVHVQRGLSFYSPEILHNQIEEGKVKVDDNGCLAVASESDDPSLTPDPPFLEFFDDTHNTDITQNPPHVTLDKSEVWFGEDNFSPVRDEATNTTVRLTNHTRGKITALWIQDPSGVFEVSPPVCDIPPLKTTDFRLVFRPNVPNQFFGVELECYVAYKSMRDYKLVNDSTITPPWCLTLAVSGHTFNGRNNTFVPEVKMGSDLLKFPATCNNESSYRTVLLQNVATTPVLYQFNQDSEDSRFTIKPRQGIMKSQFHLSACRLTPKAVESYESKVTLRLNDDDTHNENILLMGTGEQPELLLKNGGDLYFRPTCVGTVNTSSFDIQNTGRIPLAFMWGLQGRDSRMLSVEPKHGVIMPNEVQSHTWTFSPFDSTRYLFKPACYVWPHTGDAVDITSKPEPPKENRRKFMLRVIAEGGTGEIEVEKSAIDFGCVICGSPSTETLTLHNVSNCDVRFRLNVEQFVNSQYGEEPDDLEPMALHIGEYNQILPARSRSNISVTVKPRRRVLYTWSVTYELVNEKDEPIEANRHILLSEVSAEGVYPTLAVMDARTSGSGASVSKTQLWRWFSLNNLNTYLDSDPDKQELVYSVSTRRSTSRRPSVFTRSILDFNFGAAPLDSEPCYVSLMLKNSGSVISEWAFLFPKDLQLPMDYWTESGVYDHEELHELHIQDNKLFTVTPSKGKLNPGENVTILLQYKHSISGTHRIPVLFKLEHGREILLNFIGVTVEPNRRYIHFPGSKHTFTPVPIGCPTPPKQLYEVYNGGSMAVIYEVNVAPLVELQTKNFDHPILTCLNPRGEVLPGTCSNVEFIFSPVEAKTYMVDIPIHIVGGDVALISFTAIGYDARAMGPNMPLLDQPAEFTNIPNNQTVPVPGQLLFLSEERISFGNVPMFSRTRHSIFLTNRSQDHPVRFSWHASSEVVNDVLRIEPVQGRLEPGRSVQTKITFCAAGQPSFYDLDLICEVMDEVKMEGYHQELIEWEDEKARQEVEFVITDADMGKTSKQNASKASPRRLNLENVVNKQPSPLRLTESSTSGKVSKHHTKRYSTLPPILFEDPLTMPSDRTRLNRKMDSYLDGTNDEEWPQPLPPELFVCHLGITARTHDIGEFRASFPDESSKHFIDRMLQVNHPVPTRPVSEQHILTTCDKEEKDTVTLIMSKLIRSLLDDPTFHDSVHDIAKEKTPFFSQLAKEDQDDIEEVDPVSEPQEAGGDEAEAGEDEAVADGEQDGSTESARLMDQILKQGDEPVQATEDRSVSADGRRSSEKSQVSPRERHSSSPQEQRKERTGSSKSYKFEVDQEIKRSPFFGSILEEILSGTVANVMSEALRGEVVLTARPRVVALPPSTKQRSPHGDVQEKEPSRPPSSRKSGSAGSKKRKNRSRGSTSSSQSSVGKK